MPQSRRGKERGRGEQASGGATSSHAHWRARAALGTRGMGRAERERRGPARWRVADVEARRLAQGGGSRWSGDTASTVACPASRSRACKWPASAAFRAHPRVHLCLASAGRVNKREGGFGCSVTCQEWERDEKGRERWLSREEKWVSAPLIIAPWAVKHVGVRGGSGEAVGKSSAHGD